MFFCAEVRCRHLPVDVRVLRVRVRSELLGSLEYLSPYLSDEVIIIVDDFVDWSGAFKAVHDSRAKHEITTPIIQVFHAANEQLPGVYFMKPKSNTRPAHCSAKYQR